MIARMSSAAVLLLVSVLVTMGLPSPVFAQNAFERLVMPGELIKGHVKLEADCANCHSPFTPKAQDDLCLACHKDIAKDVREKHGLHGLRKDVAATPCRQCHADHKGRDADIIQLDKSTFNHGATNFVLDGKHEHVSCQECHAAGKKYRQAPRACVDCHRSADPHKGQVSDQCATCHNPKSWSQIRGFDHGKTKFALTGRHEAVACKSCHMGERYKNLSVACNDCHKAQDIHQGRNGTKCETCHTTKGWQGSVFDHDTQTKFPLLGKHQPLACEKCHKEDPRRVKVATTCVSCHLKDDVHKARLGKDCIACHGEGSWKTDTKFDHAMSRFPLEGKHAKAKCEDCHKTKFYKDAPIACSSCHSDAKTHDGRLGSSCGSCHNVTDWKHVRFDHNTQTKFKLTGRHVTTACYSCHTQRHADKVKTASDCYSCHKSQDQHHGAFGHNCGKCHTTATFGTAYIRK